MGRAGCLGAEGSRADRLRIFPDTQVSCGSYLGPQARPHLEDVAQFMEFQAPAVYSGTSSLQGLFVYRASWNQIQVFT